MRRALKPGGALGLVWNVRNARVAWVAALAHAGSIATRATRRATKAVNGGRSFLAPGFTSLSESRFAYEHVGVAERVIVERAMSVSFIAALPVKRTGARRRRSAGADRRDVVARRPSPRWRFPM